MVPSQPASAGFFLSVADARNILAQPHNIRYSKGSLNRPYVSPCTASGHRSMLVMANLVAIAQSKLYIGLRVAPPSPPLDAADFSGAVWTEIGGLATIGDLGITQNWVTQSFIDTGFDQTVKGTRAGSEMSNVFSYDANDPGQIKLRTAIEECGNYQFKLEAGAGCIPSAIATISVADPGVVTVAGGHGLSVGSPVVFSSTGTLPTGLTTGTTYYVIAAGFTATAFSVALTPGGAGIKTTGAGSGVHTVTGQPAGATALFIGMPGEGSIGGGDANTAQLQTYPIYVNSNVVRV